MSDEMPEVGPPRNDAVAREVMGWRLDQAVSIYPSWVDDSLPYPDNIKVDDRCEFCPSTDISDAIDIMEEHLKADPELWWAYSVELTRLLSPYKREVEGIHAADYAHASPAARTEAALRAVRGRRK